MEETFDLDNLDGNIPQAIKDAICDLILAWATYDVMVSYWTVQAFGMPMDSGAILLGNMDTKAKLDKLQALYRHADAKKGVTFLKGLYKRHGIYVVTRNTIIHSSCRGVYKTDKGRAVFSFMKAHGRGQMLISGVHITEIKAAALFAREAGERVFKIAGALPERN